MAAKHRAKPASSTLPPAGQGPAVEPSVAAGQALIGGALGLKLLVFVAGAVLMGLEIVGSRLLAPYFGNSVFVWGSLISLFLIALSAGYYIGGQLSDKHPSPVLLNSIVLAVAAGMFLVAAISDSVCEAILAQNFGEKAGPFVASALLFLLPSVGMGIVSPFAVRLATNTVASVGKTAGTLYALSTIGSIAGTVLTTFVLIPWIGAGAILKGLATALLVTALVTMPFRNAGAAARTVGVALAAAIACLFGIGATRASLPPDATLVADIDTPYHHISVVDDARSRQLRFDRYIESAIEIDPPHRSLSPYTNYFHLAMLPQPNIRRVLFIGAGGGVGPRAFHQHDPEMEIDLVDIDAEVLRVAYDYFHLERTPKIRAIAADGRMFVRSVPDGHYDAIILDAFTIGGRIPFHLVTREFIELCRAKLAPGGVFLMNINSALSGPSAGIFHSMFKTINSVFADQTQAFAIRRHMMRSDETTNIILVAVNGTGPQGMEEWSALADQYQSNSYVGRTLVENMIEDLVVTLPDMTAAAVFTDDYAPIETMSFEPTSR